MPSQRARYVLAVFCAILVLSMVSRQRLLTNKVPAWPPIASSRSTGTVADKTFLLLKTGTEVAYSRLPPHFTTTMKRFPHHAVYADTNDTVNGQEVVDCLSFLPEETLNHPAMTGYRVRRQMREQRWNWGSAKVYVHGQDTGWDLDRFKNMPAFAEAWTRSSDYDWYVMIDADSYMPVAVLEQVTRDQDPNKILYFGKAVGWDPLFAHGGSGIVLSRGAMLALFGTTEKSIRERLANMHDKSVIDCCGDGLIAREYREVTGLDPGDTLQHTEFGQFQGARIMNTIVKLSDQWCSAVGTFHGVLPWEVSVLDAWESRYEDREQPLRYYDFYRDFIMPHVRSEIPNWVAYDGPGETNRRNFESYDAEAQDKHKCYQACLNDEDCTMWTFRWGDACVLFRDLVIMGEAYNSYRADWKQEWTEVATGYMVDRIRDRRQQQPCDGLRIEAENPDEREGWFSIKLTQAGRATTNALEYGQQPLRPSEQFNAQGLKDIKLPQAKPEADDDSRKLENDSPYPLPPSDQ